MKPERRVEIVERVYWTCTIPEHRHAKEDVAKSCIAHETRVKVRLNHWTPEKYAEALALYRAGKTFAEIGKIYNVGPARGRSVVKSAMRDESIEKERRAAKMFHYAHSIANL